MDLIVFSSERQNLCFSQLFVVDGDFGNRHNLHIDDGLPFVEVLQSEGLAGERA
jgi:hypothetical protein